MRSPADDGPGLGMRGRLAVERTMRVVALLVLGVALVQALAGSGDDAPASSRASSLAASLRGWSLSASPRSAHVRVDGPVTARERDWLAALAGAGTRITWDGPALSPIAAIAEPVADPEGATRVLVAVPARSMIVLRDAFGVLDSVATGAGGARFLVRSAPAVVDASTGVAAVAARAAVPDSLRLGRVLLLGGVGWESKFVAAALEERGWAVDARLSLSPKGDVVQGPATLALDTSAYSAVVVLDTMARGEAPRILRYVRDGGGLVIAAAAAAAPAFSALGMDRGGSVLPAVEPFDTAAADPRAALALTPIALRSGVVPMERRSSSVAVAARRVERGRVIAVGYDDTWRWRLAGTGDAVAAHRDWWAALVAGVATAGAVARPAVRGVDEAPLVHWIGALGTPASEPAAARVPGRLPAGWLFGLFAAAVLVEWGSRRLRGAP